MPPPPLVVGVAGCTCAGKTTAAAALARSLAGHAVAVPAEPLGQDAYYRPAEELRPTPDVDMPPYQMWDEPDAVDWRALLARLSELSAAAAGDTVLLVEGNMLTEEPTVSAALHMCFFVTLPLDECLRRRLTRVYEPPDVDGYFERYVWPAYLRHEQRAKQAALERPEWMMLLDGTEPPSQLAHRMLVCVLRRLRADLVHLSRAPVDCRLAGDFVRSAATGAVALFVGVARSDDGTVLRLDYEAYEPMAYAKLAEACHSARRSFPELSRLAIVHRLGSVPAGEPSVVIAASSPHRRAALDACSALVDTLKKTVPLWKKEIYSDGSGAWKRNQC